MNPDKQPNIDPDQKHEIHNPDKKEEESEEQILKEMRKGFGELDIQIGEAEDDGNK